MILIGPSSVASNPTDPARNFLPFGRSPPGRYAFQSARTGPFHLKGHRVWRKRKRHLVWEPLFGPARAIAIADRTVYASDTVNASVTTRRTKPCAKFLSRRS